MDLIKYKDLFKVKNAGYFCGIDDKISLDKRINDDSMDQEAISAELAQNKSVTNYIRKNPSFDILLKYPIKSRYQKKKSGSPVYEYCFIEAGDG